MTTPKLPPAWQPTGLVQKAFNFAAERHAKVPRKGSDIPYISHLLAVAALVIEHGGTEVQAAAALLHDVLEDTDTNEADLIGLVGEEVTDIVIACSSKRFGDPKGEPMASKHLYLTTLDNKLSTDPSLLIALADKVHNSETCVNEYPTDPISQKKYWCKFNVGYDKQEIWYRGLISRFVSKGTLPTPLLTRLNSAIELLFKQP